jgi:outer membrane protein assembly factor BamB
MCGCQLSLYGHICLTSGGDFNYRPGLDESRLDASPDRQSVEPLEIRPGDWPTYQGDAQRSSTARVDLPESFERQWEFDIPGDGFPTAPVTAGGRVFFGDRNGVVRAVDANTGDQLWATYTSGAIFVPPAIEDGRLFVGSADGRVYALEATTGRQLWTFRAAPAPRWIPVYGKLMSTWPVAGGVVVQDGVVYAAAGIAHYDGTHVYALDAGTGEVKWYNDTSGATSEVANHGVSLQGELTIRDGELRFVGGGVHEEARYDLQTGRCLNQPTDEPRSSFHTSYYAYFPDYGKYDPLDCTLEDGRSLCYDCTYEGSWHGNLMLLPALPTDARRPHKPVSRWGVQRRRDAADAVWQHPANRHFNAFVVGQDLLLAAGHTVSDTGNASFLGTVKIEDGSLVWGERLSGPVVKGGLAIDHQRRVFVSVDDGRILALKPAD